ncbi:MAG: hypothetical protein LBB43_07260, partial [Spirochaetaceae bacterium]|nr:hypothetical protein [Spirochaetaceae bacterium]
ACFNVSVLVSRADVRLFACRKRDKGHRPACFNVSVLVSRVDVRLFAYRKRDKGHRTAPSKSRRFFLKKQGGLLTKLQNVKDTFIISFSDGRHFAS